MAWPERLSLILSEGPGGSPRNESLARLSSDEQLALIRNMAAQSRPESNPDRAHDVRSPLTDLVDSLGLNSSVSRPAVSMLEERIPVQTGALELWFSIFMRINEEKGCSAKLRV